MKTFIKNFVKITAVATLLFAGAAFADAASFDTNPSDNTGTVSVYLGTCEKCNGINNSVSLSSLAPGQSATINVFTDYMAQRGSSQRIYNASVRYLTENVYDGSSPSYTFTTRLMGDDTSLHEDSSSVTNLPDEWSIESLGGHIENTQALDEPNCPNIEAYNYNYPAGSSIFSSGGRDLGDLTNEVNGWCSQGTAVIAYRITNTESDGGGVDVDVKVDTKNPSNISVNGATLNGDLVTGGPVDQYWFVYSSSDETPECTAFPDDIPVYSTVVSGGSNPSFYVNQGGLNAGTEYWYQACVTEAGIVYSGGVESFVTEGSGSGNDSDPEAETKTEDNVDENSATLKGRIKMNDVDNGVVFFVYGEDESQIQSVESDYNSYDDVNNNEDGDDFQVKFVRDNQDENSWDSFSEDINGLDNYKRHYYQICVEYDDGGDKLECGGIEEFKTEDNGSGNNNDDVDIDTTSYDDVGATFATLCGDLKDDGGYSSLRTRIEFRRVDGSWVGQLCVSEEKVTIVLR